jgi:hypothetical protein
MPDALRARQLAPTIHYIMACASGRLVDQDETIR